MKLVKETTYIVEISYKEVVKESKELAVYGTLNHSIETFNKAIEVVNSSEVPLLDGIEFGALMYLIDDNFNRDFAQFKLVY